MLEHDVVLELDVGDLRLRGRWGASLSPSVSLEVCELGGDCWPPEPNTLSAGARVLRVGPFWFTDASLLLPERRGRVIAQLSQGPCFLVTVSSYVLRKLESSRGGCDPSGLPGGVSNTAEVLLPFLAGAARWAPECCCDWDPCPASEASATLRLRRAAVTAAALCEAGCRGPFGLCTDSTGTEMSS